MTAQDNTSAEVREDDAAKEAEITALIAGAGLRATPQRCVLAKHLFRNGHRHVTAEDLFSEIRGTGHRISLATVYNTLNQFRAVGLVREISVDAGRASHYDTNTGSHHHFYNEDTGALVDIPEEALGLEMGQLPAAPENTDVSGVDVVVRVRARQEEDL